MDPLQPMLLPFLIPCDLSIFHVINIIGQQNKVQTHTQIFSKIRDFHGFSYMFMGFAKMFHRNNPPTDPGASPGQVTTEVLLRDVDTILVDGALILRQARKTTCAFRLKILYIYMYMVYNSILYIYICIL
jgi:hypothetical protein